MTNTPYPEKTCEIDRLVTHPKLVEMALADKKTEQRRDGVYAYPGETFELEGVKFTVVSLERETLGDMTDASAQAEGYPSMEAYQSLILRMHAGMEWNNNSPVWVHRFQKTA